MARRRALVSYFALATSSAAVVRGLNPTVRALTLRGAGGAALAGILAQRPRRAATRMFFGGLFKTPELGTGPRWVGGSVGRQAGGEGNGKGKAER